MKQSNNLFLVIKNNFYILKVGFNICPFLVSSTFVVKLLGYLEKFYVIVFIEYLVDGLQNGSSFYQLSALVALAAVLLLLIRTAEVWYSEKWQPLMEQTLLEKMNLDLFQKAWQADLACFEDPVFYGDYTKAMNETALRVSQAIDNLSILLGTVVVSAFYLVKLSSIDPFAIIVVILPIVSTCMVAPRLYRLEYQMNMDNIEPNRKKEYVKRTVYLKNFAQEIRLSSIFLVLRGSFYQAVEQIFTNIKKYSYKMMFMRILQRLLAGSFPTILFLIYESYRCLVTQTVSISGYTVVFYGVLSLSNILAELVNSIMALQQHSLYIENYKAFLAYSPKIQTDSSALSIPEHLHSLTLEDVSFCYFGSDVPVLSHVNLTLCLDKLEKIAIVGNNGAGKSTLIKLLLRLYDPTEGRILLNGIDIRKFDVLQYRALFGTVFQDFSILSMSVAENINMKKVEKKDRPKIEAALKAGGIWEKIQSLPQKADTILTREFDDSGAILSGGESQKIAIARVFASQSKIAILDEPSSALDPIAESRMFDSIMEVCKERSVIFISHRLSSCALCDRVYYFENGKVIEEGTPAYLRSSGGKFQEMFEKQSIHYR